MFYSSVSFEDVLETAAAILTHIRESASFRVFLFLAAIYTVVLLADIVLLLFLRGLRSNLRATLYGMNIPKGEKGKIEKRWEKIEKKLKSNNESQFKVAVIEADGLADEILKKIGYAGRNMKERMERIHPGQIDNYEDVKRAHEIRNRVVYEKDFELDLETAKNTLKTYEDLLRNLELFD